MRTEPESRVLASTPSRSVLSFFLGLFIGAGTPPGITGLWNTLFPWTGSPGLSGVIAQMVTVMSLPILLLITAWFLTWRRSAWRFLAWGASAGSFLILLVMLIIGFLNMPIPLPG